ncbi:MAG: hypothetical protein JO246_04370 [Frankiaceae bacterium]|nr:hypothetical protein [Frankiaceae bacterium]MBV9872260.1 hypothetical protein [Frankiaceae bacterium]
MKAARIKAIVAAGSATVALGVVAAPHGASAAPAKTHPHSAVAHPVSTKGLHPHGSVPTRGLTANVVPTTDEGGGYWFYPSSTIEGFASASTTFTMPNFTCASNSDQEWLLPGIWGFNSGTLTSQVDVNFNCNNGSKLQVGYACAPDGTCGNSLTPNPGDVMEASLTETATGSVARLRDFTQNTSTSASGAAGPLDDVILIGTVGPDWFFGGVVRKVPTFNHVTFRFASINGEAIGDGDYFPTQYNLRTDSFNQINAGPILLHHTMFTNTFKHN